MAHTKIQANLAVAMGGRLKGGPCGFCGSTLKIEATGRIRYPDAFVTCSRAPNTAIVVRDPVVLFEVFSPSKSGTDRIVTTLEHQAPPSVRRCVILEQDQIGATVFTGVAADWTVNVLVAGAILSLPEIGSEASLDELYDDRDLTA